MALRFKGFGSVFVPALAALAVSLAGCGGPSQEAASPDDPPPLDDDPAAAGGGGEGESDGPPAAASSGEVKEGMDAIQAGDFAKAKAVLTSAVKKNPKDPQAAYYLGVAVESLGDPKEAAGHYKKAVELDPKLTEASINLSGVLIDGEDFAGALAAADHGLKSAPKNPGLLRNRAVALDAAGSKDSPAAFRAALAAKPDDTEVRYLLAESLARTGDEKGAAAEAKGLVEASDVAVLASAARLLGKLKAFPDCVAALDKAIGQKDVAELRVQRGICKHGQKDEKGAAADFDAAIAKDGKFAPAYYYLGQSKLAAKDKAAAKAAFKKAKELDPGGKIGAAAEKELAGMK